MLTLALVVESENEIFFVSTMHSTASNSVSQVSSSDMRPPKDCKKIRNRAGLTAHFTVSSSAFRRGRSMEMGGQYNSGSCFLVAIRHLHLPLNSTCTVQIFNLLGGQETVTHRGVSAQCTHAVSHSGLTLLERGLRVCISTNLQEFEFGRNSLEFGGIIYILSL